MSKKYSPDVNPIHEKDGKWYFWDETETTEHGPFDTEALAKEALDAYAKVLDETPVEVEEENPDAEIKGTLSTIKGDATKPVGEGIKFVIHCCNDFNLWGAGFVLAISKKWPEPHDQYRLWAADSAPLIKDGTVSGPFKLGECQFVPVEDDIIIVNMIGQHGVGSQTVWPEGSKTPKTVPPIRYEAIEECLKKVAKKVRVMRQVEDDRVIAKNAEYLKLDNPPKVVEVAMPVTVHCPKFGAGLARGNWETIEGLLTKELINKGIDVTVYTL